MGNRASFSAITEKFRLSNKPNTAQRPTNPAFFQPLPIFDPINSRPRGQPTRPLLAAVYARFSIAKPLAALSRPAHLHHLRVTLGQRSLNCGFGSLARRSHAADPSRPTAPGAPAQCIPEGKRSGPSRALRVPKLTNLLDRKTVPKCAEVAFAPLIGPLRGD